MAFSFSFSTILQVSNADVNMRDADGWTPLHAAIHWGNQTATELLTEAGADFDLKNDNVRIRSNLLYLLIPSHFIMALSVDLIHFEFF